MKGRIFLLPSSLSEEVNHAYFNPYTTDIIRNTQYFIVEKTKTARRFMKALFKDKEIDTCKFFELNKHSDDLDIQYFLNPALEGNDMAIISEAGCPGIADPGSVIVKKAHEKGIRVIPVPGPSSIYMALMASGFNGQQFEFLGYLSKEQKERRRQLQNAERKAQNGISQIFMETPFRNMHLLEDTLENCSSSTLLCLARNITEKDEFIQSQTIAEWRKQKVDLHKRPCIFILGN
ncbi:MAG: SAM-dependent methyltransferase [Bacteroidota bacterium]